MINTCGCLSSLAMDDIDFQKKQTREKINKLKWLESLEENKLYKNQQKLETATNNLSYSKSEIAEMQKKLNTLEAQLSTASSEYNSLNQILAQHLRNAYKSQRNARFQIILNSDDINYYGSGKYHNDELTDEQYKYISIPAYSIIFFKKTD